MTAKRQLEDDDDDFMEDDPLSDFTRGQRSSTENMQIYGNEHRPGTKESKMENLESSFEEPSGSIDEAKQNDNAQVQKNKTLFNSNSARDASKNKDF